MIRLIAALFVCALYQLPAVAESKTDYVQKKQQTEQELAQLKVELEQNKQHRRELVSALEAAADNVDNRDARISELQREADLFEAQVDELDQNLNKLQEHVLESERQLARMIQRSRQNHAGDSLQILLQNDDPTRAQRLSVYYTHYFHVQNAAINDTREQLELISAAQAEALKSRNWLLHLKKKAGVQRNKFIDQGSNARLSLENLEQKLAQQSKGLQALEQEQQRLATLIESLKDSARGASGQFAFDKGRYPFPVSGEITSRFGAKKAGGKLKWTGIEINTPPGSAVRVIADGEIAYADWLQGQGLLVIVDHGDGYMTLYGGNSALAVSQGQWVEHGATIATVGESVGQNLSGAYFEIRHNAKPIDPEAWIDPKNLFDSADISVN